MAITQSLGYGGSVGEGDLPTWLRAFAGKYGVLGAEDWKVTIKPAADRTLVVAPGAGFGHTVVDTNDATEVAIQLEILASGTRWDMIVAHRDWSGAGGTTTFADITGTSSQLATFSTRDDEPGDVDDQPLALVRVDGGVGGGSIGAVIDLRVWVAAGGAYATDELVLQYMNEIGTQIRIGSYLFTSGFDETGIQRWSKTPVATTRAWSSFRTTTDAWTGEGTMVSAPAISSAPAGDYSISASASIRSNIGSIGPGAKRIIVNGATAGVSEQDDIQGNDHGWMSKQHQTVFRHAGGSMTVAYLVAAPYGASVQGAQLLVTFLGPVA